MFDLIPYLEKKQKLVNDSLRQIINHTISHERLVSAVNYSLMAGGKRLRPILCLAACEAVSGTYDQAISAACALEMIHTYSLIHDDLPAMDDDKLRRGKQTCHIKYDDATAILAGDALLTYAFQILSSNKPKTYEQAANWITVINNVSTAAGIGGMVEGQIRDVTSEGTQLTLDQLEKIHLLKTGALIKSAITSGAILGYGTSIMIEQLEIYAENIGLAFQITDDILNVEGDPRVLGKETGTDQNRGKNTYPALLGISKSRELIKGKINNALQALDNFDNKSDPLRAIAQYIIVRKK